jgi:hypothetical protein
MTRYDHLLPIPAKKMLYCLSTVKPALAKLMKQGKPYDPLIEAILSLDEKGPLPTSKALQQQVGISPAVFKKWLDALHADFFTRIETNPDVLTFPSVEYLICAPGRGENICFLCRLPHPPRVGEGMDFSFLHGRTGSRSFYVDAIHHEYEQDKVTVMISLQAGYFNPYLWHLQARARFEQTLDYKLEEELGGYGQQDYLRKIYPPTRETLDAYWKESARRAEEQAKRKKARRKRAS